MLLTRPTAVSPLPGRHPLRLRESPQPGLRVSRPSLILQQARVSQVLPVDPGVPLANHLPVDVAAVVEDLGHGPAVAIGVHDLELDHLAEDFARESLLRPGLPRAGPARECRSRLSGP